MHYTELLGITLFFNMNTTIQNLFKQIYGISVSFINFFLKKFGICNKIYRHIKLKNLDSKLFLILYEHFDKYFLLKNSLLLKEGSLLFKYQRFLNYKGYRHYHGLPSNGQRTHTNARTCRSLIYHKKLKLIIDYFNSKETKKF